MLGFDRVILLNYTVLDSVLPVVEDASGRDGVKPVVMQPFSPPEAGRPFGRTNVPRSACTVFASDVHFPSKRDANSTDGTCLSKVEVVLARS